MKNTTIPPPARRQRGMTLVEIMMVIGIIGITLTLGVPSMVSMVDDMRLSSSANDYLGFLNLARSEAGKRGLRITVCASSDFINCSAPASQNWAVGALAFMDTNSDGVVNNSEAVVRVLDAMPPGVTVIAATATVGANNGFFRYIASGSADSVRSFVICKTGRAARNVSVSLPGRASVATGATCP